MDDFFFIGAPKWMLQWFWLTSRAYCSGSHQWAFLMGSCLSQSLSTSNFSGHNDISLATTQKVQHQSHCILSSHTSLQNPHCPMCESGSEIWSAQARALLFKIESCWLSYIPHAIVNAQHQIPGKRPVAINLCTEYPTQLACDKFSTCTTSNFQQEV